MHLLLSAPPSLNICLFEQKQDQMTSVDIAGDGLGSSESKRGNRATVQIVVLRGTDKSEPERSRTELSR